MISDPLPDGTSLMVNTESGGFRTNKTDDFTELQNSESGLDAPEDELRLTRHRLRTAVEELESSDEEMMSMNEELRPTNEKLAAVNAELKTKVGHLTKAN